jgi:hypothetical protein
MLAEFGQHALPFVAQHEQPAVPRDRPLDRQPVCGEGGVEHHAVGVGLQIGQRVQIEDQRANRAGALLSRSPPEPAGAP